MLEFQFIPGLFCLLMIAGCIAVDLRSAFLVKLHHFLIAADTFLIPTGSFLFHHGFFLIPLCLLLVLHGLISFKLLLFLGAQIHMVM